VHAACDLNFTVKGEGLLKVLGSHVHWKSGNISQTMLDNRYCNSMPLTGSDTRVWPMAAIVMTLSVFRSFPYPKHFQV